LGIVQLTLVTDGSVVKKTWFDMGNVAPSSVEYRTSTLSMLDIPVTLQLIMYWDPAGSTRPPG